MDDEEAAVEAAAEVVKTMTDGEDVYCRLMTMMMTSRLLLLLLWLMLRCCR